MIDEFVLIQDDDGHWYVCPAEKQGEASEAFEAIDTYWQDMEAEGDAPEVPPYLVRVGGAPSLVRFTGYRFEGDAEASR